MSCLLHDPDEQESAIMSGLFRPYSLVVDISSFYISCYAYSLFVIVIGSIALQTTPSASRSLVV